MAIVSFGERFARKLLIAGTESDPFGGPIVELACADIYSLIADLLETER